MARVLSSVGIPCGHEVFFDPLGIEGALERLGGGSSLELSLTSRMKVYGQEKTEMITPYLDILDDLQGESSYMAAPFLDHSALESADVIHVVRNPFNVIDSFVNSLAYFHTTKPTSKYGQRYEKFITDHIPETLQEMQPYERAALYWMRWNEMIEAKSKGKRYILVRAEEGPLPLLRWLGIPPGQQVFDDRSVNTYHRSVTMFTIDELPDSRLKEEFVALGRRYGYSMASKKILL